MGGSAAKGSYGASRAKDRLSPTERPLLSGPRGHCRPKAEIRGAKLLPKNGHSPLDMCGDAKRAQRAWHVRSIEG